MMSADTLRLLAKRRAKSGQKYLGTGQCSRDVWPVEYMPVKGEVKIVKVKEENGNYHNIIIPQGDQKEGNLEKDAQESTQH